MKILMPLLMSLLLFSNAAVANLTPADSFNLRQYQGKVVLLDFWASWCGPCRQSFPWLRDMQEKYVDQGLVIVGVSVDESAAMAEKFIRRHHRGPGANLQLLHDPNGQLAEHYQLQGMPNSFLIDRQGRLQHTHIGFQPSDAAALELHIRQMLAAPATGAM